ncbi:MAG: DNA repair protein RecO [Candidatus Paceibacterota bacterium]|jgi:DNA repair protein RecO
MSHRLYHTEAFVLQHRPRGEDSKLLYLFTADFGLILVVAQGVRKLGSKMRANITDYSFGDYSLVRGREFWRLVSAQKRNDFSATFSSPKKRLIAGNVFRLLMVLTGEEESQEIFEDLKQAFGWLSQIAEDDKLVSVIERMLVLRLLSHLGYLKSDPIWLGLVAGDWTREKLATLMAPPLNRDSTIFINKMLRDLHW